MCLLSPPSAGLELHMSKEAAKASMTQAQADLMMQQYCASQVCTKPLQSQLKSFVSAVIWATWVVGAGRPVQPGSAVSIAPKAVQPEAMSHSELDSTQSLRRRFQHMAIAGSISQAPDMDNLLYLSVDAQPRCAC